MVLYRYRAEQNNQVQPREGVWRSALLVEFNPPAVRWLLELVSH
jgi:hypothetical protein